MTSCLQIPAPPPRCQQTTERQWKAIWAPRNKSIVLGRALKLPCPRVSIRNATRTRPQAQSITTGLSKLFFAVTWPARHHTHCAAVCLAFQKLSLQQQDSEQVGVPRVTCGAEFQDCFWPRACQSFQSFQLFRLPRRGCSVLLPQSSPAPGNGEFSQKS